MKTLAESIQIERERHNAVMDAITTRLTNLEAKTEAQIEAVQEMLTSLKTPLKPISRGLEGMMNGCAPLESFESIKQGVAEDVAEHERMTGQRLVTNATQ